MLANVRFIGTLADETFERKGLPEVKLHVRAQYSRTGFHSVIQHIEKKDRKQALAKKQKGSSAV